MSNIDAERLFSEAAEKLKTEAFIAGWHAALAAVEKALNELRENPPVGIVDVVVENSVKGKKGGSPTQGTTPYYIYMAVKNRPGLTGGQVAEEVKKAGHSAPAGSIRTSIQRLKRRHLIVLRHGKWFVK